MANSRLCSIPDCGKKHYGLGLCHTHYELKRRNGTHLGRGGTSKGALLRFIEDVAIKHVSNECLTWPFGANQKGYGILRIDGRHNLAHRYVCKLAHGSPPSPRHQAAHGCGKGHLGCVNPYHLRWATPKENSGDRVIHGTSGRGGRRKSP